MDEPDHRTSRSGNGGLPADKDLFADESAAATSEDGSTIVYCGEAQRVNEGLAIALRLLGLSLPVLDGDTRIQSKDGE